MCFLIRFTSILLSTNNLDELYHLTQGAGAKEVARDNTATQAAKA